MSEENIDNILCTPNYIRRSDHKVCHDTAWVKIKSLVVLGSVSIRRIIVLIENTLDETIFETVLP